MSSPLDNLIVLMPWGELGYQTYHKHLLQNPDYGYLINQGRVFSGTGGYTHSNPQTLLRGAMKGEIEGRRVPPFGRVLWLEHDHTFPDDVFQRHASYREPLVSGLYVWREVTQPLPVIYKWDEGRQSASFYNAVELEAMGIFDDDLNSPKRGLHKVDVVPLGCLSVRRDVYESWPSDRPYFSSGTTPSGVLVGHDNFHCRVAQDAGWPIFVDTSMRVKHYALLELDDSFFKKWMNTVRIPQILREAGFTDDQIRAELDRTGVAGNDHHNERMLGVYRGLTAPEGVPASSRDVAPGASALGADFSPKL